MPIPFSYVRLHSLKKKMEERDQERQPIDARPEGTGRLRAGVAAVKGGAERTWLHVEDAAWFLREKVAWPARDGLGNFGGRAREGYDGLGTRGRIGVFGGGAVALGAVVAAIAIGAGGGSGSGATTTEALVVRQTPAPAVSAAPVATPKKKTSPKPSGPTLHGPAPDFHAAKDVKAGVGGNKALGGQAASEGTTDGEGPAARGAGDVPASTAKIGSTPQASASAQAQSESLTAEGKTSKGSGVGLAENEDGGEGASVTGPVAPKAAKQTARHFAEAFVLYEVGGVEGKVKSAFHHTSTKQLARALLRRPPRQPDGVKVPQAKVVNVVAGPSNGGVYPVSVSLLRVGVTSELRLQLEEGVGGKWQVTDVLG
jgi:hypothetical protein